MPETRMPSDFAVRVEDLSVTYRTTLLKRPTLQKRLRRLGRGQRTVHEVHAIRDMSFQIEHGKAVGIIGVNGAGKSSLMRTIAGILPPTKGFVEVHGRVSTLLALGIGFNRDLSGRENVVLGALAAGLSRAEIEERYDEVTGFAELGDAIDFPMRTYSSGMYGRLAFAVALVMRPDILLIDEALSVGDARFKRKSFLKMEELCAQSGTIVIVSHALKSIRRLCDDVIWIHEGEIAMRGEPDPVIEAYRRFLEIGEDDDVALEDL